MSGATVWRTRRELKALGWCDEAVIAAWSLVPRRKVNDRTGTIARFVVETPVDPAAALAMRDELLEEYRALKFQSAAANGSP